MPSTGYRYYTVVMANALLAEGMSIPDNSKRRPDQMLRNLLSAYGYEDDHEVSYATLLNDMERDGLTYLLDDLEAKNYWNEFIGRVALPEAASQYTVSDPLQPLLDAAAAFERAVGMLFDMGDLVAGNHLRDVHYLLAGVTLDEIVDRTARREPQVVNALLRATRRASAPFDEHPLAAQFILARLFQLIEDLLGRALYERVERGKKVVGRPVADVVREVAERNPALAVQIDRLRRQAPGYLGLAQSDACFRPQHVRPELTREGNPLKIIAQDLKKKADPLLCAAALRIADLHRDPSFSLALAFALPGSHPVMAMLDQALERRRLGGPDVEHFPSVRTLLAWLYGGATRTTRLGLPTALANFAERDRLSLACPNVLVEEVRVDVERRLASHGFDPREGGGSDVVDGFTQALLDALPIVAADRDPDRRKESARAASNTAESLWAKATHPHLVRIVRSRDDFRDRLSALPRVGGRAVPWTKVLGRLGSDADDADLPRPARLDFTEVWPTDDAPLAPELHSFGSLVGEPFAVEGEAWSFDDNLKDWVVRLDQRRVDVLPETTKALLRALTAWVERIRLHDEPQVADTRMRLFFLDGGKAGQRAGFAPRSIGLPETDPQTWSSNGLPSYAFVERFTLSEDTVHSDREEVLDALQAFVEVVREVESALRGEWWTAMRERAE